jgi:Uma2 family endonuclease
MDTLERESSTPITQPLVLHLEPAIKLTDEQFFEFCQLNRELRIERTASGELEVMSPTGGETGGSNFNLIGLLWIWIVQDGTGKGFDSSTGFKLPSGAERSPDAAWVKLDRWNALTPEQQKKFPPVTPDFVVELRSESDTLSSLQTKMQEWIDNGVRLGWLIDRKHRRVYIYRPGVDVECLDNPATVSGEPVLPGFVLDMSKIW